MKLITLLFVTTFLLFASFANADDNGLSDSSDSFALSSSVAVGPAILGPIDTQIGGPWLEFQFGEAFAWAEPCLGGVCVPSSGGNSIFLISEPPWTFTFPFGGGTLTVTDAFFTAILSISTIWDRSSAGQALSRRTAVAAVIPRSASLIQRPVPGYSRFQPASTALI